MNTIKLMMVAALTVGLYSCSEQKVDDGIVHEVSDGNELLTDNQPVADMATYPTTSEGESESMMRSFENAPPLIPHTIDGMYQLTAKENQCIMCHFPAKTDVSKATPMPETHFTNFRPEIKEHDGIYEVDAEENEVVAVSTGDQINEAMFNCNQCHVPQAKVDLEVENLFQAEYRSGAGKTSSNLKETISEGVQ